MRGGFSNPIGMKFVRIESGEFVMGSPANEQGRRASELQHKVKITKAFWMQTTPVTQVQWKAVMGTTPSHFAGDELPVDTVSWNDAVEFCKRLSAKEQKDYRLPTEAEWEYACRAGTSTAYYSGDGENALANVGWYKANSDSLTHRVALKAPNNWGIYDMHGNLRQWCADYWGDYPTGDVIDPKGAESTPDHVLRGGSWCDAAQYCRSAARSGGGPTSRYDFFGFRVALDCAPASVQQASPQQSDALRPTTASNSQSLLGTWELIASNERGRPLTAEQIYARGECVNFKSDGMLEIAEHGLIISDGTYKLSLDENPFQMEQTTPGQSGTVRRIYRIDGDTLICACHPSGKSVPVDFTPGDQRIIETFRRRQVTLQRGKPSPQSRPTTGVANPQADIAAIKPFLGAWVKQGTPGEESIAILFTHPYFSDYSAMRVDVHLPGRPDGWGRCTIRDNKISIFGGFEAFREIESDTQFKFISENELELTRISFPGGSLNGRFVRRVALEPVKMVKAPPSSAPATRGSMPSSSPSTAPVAVPATAEQLAILKPYLGTWIKRGATLDDQVRLTFEYRTLQGKEMLAVIQDGWAGGAFVQIKLPGCPEIQRGFGINTRILSLRMALLDMGGPTLPDIEGPIVPTIISEDEIELTHVYPWSRLNGRYLREKEARNAIAPTTQSVVAEAENLPEEALAAALRDGYVMIGMTTDQVRSIIGRKPVYSDPSMYRWSVPATQRILKQWAPGPESRVRLICAYFWKERLVSISAGEYPAGTEIPGVLPVGQQIIPSTAPAGAVPASQPAAGPSTPIIAATQPSVVVPGAVNPDAETAFQQAEALRKATPPKYADGFPLYRKAAELGHAGAQAELGMCYLVGHGVARDERTAIEWFRKSADAGNAVGQRYLAFRYLSKNGVLPQDYDKARELLLKAAAQGDAIAQSRLANLYFKGEGVAKDEATGAQWVLKAAEQGYPAPQFAMGELCFSGLGVRKDEVAAARWYLKAAEQGHPQAQYMLGRLYDQGRGVVRNRIEAMKWLQKAAQQGSTEAKAYLARMMIKH